MAATLKDEIQKKTGADPQSSEAMAKYLANTGLTTPEQVAQKNEEAGLALKPKNEDYKP